MKRTFFVILLVLGCIISVRADDSIVKKTPKFSVAPTGRLLIDGALYLPSSSDFRAGVSIPEVRLGAYAKFDDFDAKVEWGYSFNKFAPRDIYISWYINEHSYLRAGYFIHQYGLQSATGSSHKIGMEEPIPQTVFGNPRLLGAMYLFHNRPIFAAVSLFAQNGSMLNTANSLGRTGVGVLGRFVYHPFAETGKIVAVGVSPQWQSPAFAGKPEEPFASFKSNFPTKTSSVQAVGVTVDSVRSVIKFTPEITLAYDRWALESQFYYAHTFRKYNLPAWSGTGVYVQARVILNRGMQYEYNGAAGCIALPKPKTWEIVVGYNYTNTNSPHSGICGGRANNLNVTLNYQINKWLTWRFNYSWTRVADGSPLLVHPYVNILQTRFQAIF